jgi:phospholipid-binding lipoprotein MlaA
MVMLLAVSAATGCSKKAPQLSSVPEQHIQSEGSTSATNVTMISPGDTDELSSDDVDDDEYEYLDEYADEGPIIADPLEPFNRIMFTFNDKLYYWLLKPTASVYASIFPQQFRNGIQNVFYNLAFPIRFVSNILQLKLGKATQEVGCFAVNTTFGIGGLVKISDHIEPLQDVSSEDLGQALAYYGIGDGIYIVWPILGPSTLRDSTGKVGEYFLDPINYYIDDWKISAGIKAGQTVNYTSLHQNDYDDLKEAAFDPYESLKDFYIQYRIHLVRD